MEAKMKLIRYFFTGKILILMIVLTGCKNIAEPVIYSEENIPIEYTIDGTGDNAVVFVHCWSCDKSYWDLQISFFSENYKVIAIDLPGHGESDYERDTWSMQAFGRDVAAVVQGLGLDKVVLVGHSMGGSVILAAAQELDTTVVGLVGVDTFQDFESAFSEEEFSAFFKPFQDNFRETTRNYVSSLFPSTADSVLVDRIVTDMSSAPPEVALGSFQGLFAFKPVPVLEQIKAPLYGINSDMYPVNIEAGKRHTTKFDIRFMEGHGHFLNQEDPETFNRMLAEVLEEIFGEN